MTSRNDVDTRISMSWRVLIHYLNLNLNLNGYGSLARANCNIGIFSLLCLTLVPLSGETKAHNGKRMDVCDTPIWYLYACTIWPAQVDG